MIEYESKTHYNYPMLTVKTPVFEGPLDLLLSLIEKRKLFINDISLSKVTDDYISYINSPEGNQNISLGARAHFILVASTLLLIKSKSLLPTLSLTEEEQVSIEDLEARLKEYKRIKELSVHVRERFGRHILFTKIPRKNVAPVFSPEKSITVSGLLMAIKDVIKNIPKIEAIPKAVVKKVISLEEMIERLTDRVKAGLKMSFREFAGAHGKGAGKVIPREERVNIIVSFLAMLELVKQGIINVHQEDRHNDIHMETQDVSLPSYGSQN